jgi:hypothetical protein
LKIIKIQLFSFLFLITNIYYHIIMAQQYSDTTGLSSPSDDYAELSGYYQANPVPANSLLTFNIYPDDTKYFDLNRKTNRKVPDVKPRSYEVLEGRGPYTPYSEGFKQNMMNGRLMSNNGGCSSRSREGFTVVSPQLSTAGGSVMNNKWDVASKQDSELIYMAYNNSS